MTLSLRDDDEDLARELPSALHQQQELVGISGWLAFAALGLIVGIARTLFGAGSIALAASRGGGAVLWLGLAFTAFELAILGVVAWLFFTKHRFTRIAMPLLYLGYGLLSLALLLASWLAEDDGEVGFARALLGLEVARCTLWTGYFLRSRRVKQTFVR